MVGIKDESKRRIFKSNYQLLGCGAKGMLPSKIKDNRKTVDEITQKLTDFVTAQFKHLGAVPLGESY